jgi:CBS-domain-containing membrane protein
LNAICTKDLLCAYKDEAIHDAFVRMSARGLRQLPVVDRTDPRHILGLLEQEKITLVCSLTLMQQSLHAYLESASTIELQNAELPGTKTLSVPQSQAPV